MNKLSNKVLKKLQHNNCTIFLSKWCTYSIDAYELLEKNNIDFKAYNIDSKQIGGKENLIKSLNELNSQKYISKYNINHNTRPMIFFKKEFIGGLEELTEKIK